MKEGFLQPQIGADERGLTQVKERFLQPQIGADVGEAFGERYVDIGEAFSKSTQVNDGYLFILPEGGKCARAKLSRRESRSSAAAWQLTHQSD